MKKYFFIASLFLSVAGLAQSYHNSQFYSTPILVNPAFTGYTDGPYRVATNYRSQWGSGGAPFTTISFSADVSPMRDRLAEGNRLGLGLAVINDKTLGGAMQSNFVALSTAYNVALNDERTHRIGLGFQAVYNERRIDYNKLYFENQLGPGGFDPGLPVGEPLPGDKRGYFNVSAGSVYNVDLEDRSFFIGASVFNILRQKNSILPEEYKTPQRYVASAGGMAFVGYNGIVYFSTMFQRQAKASEFTIGSAYGIQLGDEQKQVVSLGAWYRYKDALIPYVGFQLRGFQAGLSFDYTVSQLKTSGQTRNGFEVSLVYTAEDKSELKRLIPWY